MVEVPTLNVRLVVVVASHTPPALIVLAPNVRVLVVLPLMVINAVTVMPLVSSVPAVNNNDPDVATTKASCKVQVPPGPLKINAPKSPIDTPSVVIVRLSVAVKVMVPV